MKSLLFVTSNKRKIREAQDACCAFSIEIEPVTFEIHEIQSDTPMDISLAKAEAAFVLLHKPLVVTDTYWSIPALNGFPGAYMKYIQSWFTPEHFIRLMQSETDRSVSFTETITYTDGDVIKTFSHDYWGKIVDVPRGSGNCVEQVAEFDGLTLGEHRERNETSHKPEDYIWWDFAKWYEEYI